MILVLLILAVLCIVLLIVYKLFWLKVSANVNCWFCNENSSVPYGSRNSWDCCFCGQYNGFKADGDYNKVIPAMFCEDASAPAAASPYVDIACTSEFLVPTKSHENNGTRHDLCSICSQNQLLKIKQLANFVPQNEANFDIEVEAYKHHLEQVYRLCPTCDLSVRRELSRQDALIRAKMHDVGLLRSQSTINANVSRLSTTDLAESKPTSFKVSSSVSISLLLQFISVLVGLVLATAMVDFLSISYNLFPLIDGEVLRTVRHYCGPVAAVGIFVEIAAVMVAGQARLRPVDVVACFSWLLTLLACGWLRDSAVIVRLVLTSLTVIASSCSLVYRGCGELRPESRLSCEMSDNSTPVTVRQRHTADFVEQTKPEDPKFVARIKMLNLGASRKHHSSKGPFGMSGDWASPPVNDTVWQCNTTAHSCSTQRDRPLLSPAKFIPASSTLTSTVRPPSKWSPVSSDLNKNRLPSQTSKSGYELRSRHVGPDVINGCDRQVSNL